jgi:hypothetical protein
MVSRAFQAAFWASNPPSTYKRTAAPPTRRRPKGGPIGPPRPVRAFLGQIIAFPNPSCQHNVEMSYAFARLCISTL